MTDEQRITRLVGDGEGGGGGIPLPPVFGAILEHLQNERVATFAELSKVVSTALEYKKARVFVTWRNWKAVTTDFLVQLEKEGFITRPEEGFYRSAVKPGADLLVIPEHGIRVTVHDAARKGLLDKLSEVRSEAVLSGLLNKDIEQHLTEIAVNVTEKTSKRQGKRVFHAGSITPLENESGVYRMCTSCGEDFELTEDNFRAFKSHGEHYRSRLCVPCAKDLDDETRAARRAATQVKRDMEKLINEADPSLREVMTRFGLDDYLARRYWDDLAMMGKVPGRDRAMK